MRFVNSSESMREGKLLDFFTIPINQKKGSFCYLCLNQSQNRIRFSDSGCRIRRQNKTKSFWKRTKGGLGIQIKVSQTRRADEQTTSAKLRQIITELRAAKINKLAEKVKITSTAKFRSSGSRTLFISTMSIKKSTSLLYLLQTN